MHDLTAARKNATTDEDAAAIAWAQDEIERLTAMVRFASDQGVTFPPETLPRVSACVVAVNPSDGSETLIYDPDLQNPSKH